MAIMREERGLEAIWGICKNSSRSIEPEPSLGRIVRYEKGRGGWGGGPIEFHETFLESF
jgi:hypothetical protein